MTSRQLLQATLGGEPVARSPCAPLAVHYTATLAGRSTEDYTRNPEVMVDCICRYYERFRPDGVWLSADTWVTAEAMGARVEFPGNNQPMAGAGEAMIQSAADLDRIPPADPSTQGRMPMMLEAMGRLRRRLGDEVFIVGCFDQSPLSLACAMGGINEIMMKALTEPEPVQALLERCIEYASAYANALGAAGADLLSTGDSPAGLMGPDLYRELALPAERRVFAAIAKGCGVPASLHICGDATPLLADMATAGAAVLEIDYKVDLTEACRIVPDDITLLGNLDPVNLLQDGSPDQVTSAARRALAVAQENRRTRFILSSGCTLTPRTPAANLDALFAAARQAAAHQIPGNNPMTPHTPNRTESLALLKKYNQTESLLRHAYAVEAVMRHLARKHGEDEEKWGVIGLVHDLDYEQFPDEHCVLTERILREESWPEHYIRAVLSHAWGMCTDVEPLTLLEKCLYAVDELTGLVAATVWVRPSKSIHDLTPKSVRKKWKQKSFAAGVDREVIEKGATMLGVEINELIRDVIEGMQGVADELGMAGAQPG